MARYTTSLHSPLAPEEAFDALADFTTVADWDPGVTRSVRVDDGDLGVGSQFDVDVAIGPATLTFRYELTEYERPGRFVLRAERTPFVSEDTITVEEAGDHGSVVTYDAVLELQSVLGLADPLLGIGFQRVGDRAAAGLRSHLSATTAH